MDEVVVVVAEGKRSSDEGPPDSSYPLTVDEKCSRKFSSQGIISDLGGYHTPKEVQSASLSTGT